MDQRVMSSQPTLDLKEDSGSEFTEGTSTHVAVYSIVAGCVLLVEGFFLFMVAEDKSILKAGRIVVVHHAFLIVLLATNAIISNALYLQDSKHPICLAFRIIREVMENLIHWSLALLALLGLAMFHVQGRWYEFLNNLKLHTGLVIALWGLCGVIEIVIFVLPKSWENFRLGSSTCPFHLAKATTHVVSHVVLVVLVVMGYFSARRCARLVSAEQLDFLTRSKSSRQIYVAGTLAIVCRLVAVIDLMTSILYLYRASAPSCKWPLNSSLGVLFYLWYLGQACIFPIFLARHPIFRQHLKRAICHKCFWPQNTKFDRTIECRYSTEEVCREFLSTPMGQLSLKRHKEAAKARSEGIVSTRSKSGALA